MRNVEIIDADVQYELSIRSLPPRPAATLRTTLKQHVQHTPALKPCAGGRLQVITARGIQRFGAALNQNNAIAVIRKGSGQGRAGNSATDNRQVAIDSVAVHRITGHRRSLARPT
jgi:hypothetical protein